ncbi:hypothetical protein GGR52DRAFT_468968 [Hypoxylon sp. FL1284]|nr:hypothetical protein GGR52DRAFT_468968 [Hypoxylon sp. FL1284]
MWKSGSRPIICSLCLRMPRRTSASIICSPRLQNARWVAFVNISSLPRPRRPHVSKGPRGRGLVIATVIIIIPRPDENRDRVNLSPSYRRARPRGTFLKGWESVLAQPYGVISRRTQGSRGVTRRAPCVTPPQGIPRPGMPRGGKGGGRLSARIASASG